MKQPDKFKRKEKTMGKKTATKSDKLFEETKLRMVMRLNNMTRKQAAFLPMA